MTGRTATFESGSLRCSRTDPLVLRAAVDRRLSALFHDEESELDRAIRYAVLTPGKRIRPILTVLASWELGARDLRALDVGCALEMVHAASLVLDDLPCMDDAATRRGAPTTHVAFGEDVALLVSIALLGRAFGTISAAPGLSAEQRTRLVAVLAQTVGAQGLAGGQHRDLRGHAPSAIAAIDEANHRKTGVLFVAAAEMAGIVMEAAPPEVERLRRFATDLGHAFQILDDLADGCEADGAPGEDSGKTTVPSVLGREGARRRLHGHLADATRELQAGGSLAMFVGTIFGQTAVPARPYALAAPAL